MKGLSAKVFRTYNASILLQQQLASTPKDATVADKMLHYNRANRLVAELCNHQRAAAKNHGAAMEKLADKVKAIKYQRMKLRYTLWAVDADNKKKHKQYKDMESDLEDDWCEAHEKDLMEKEKAKIKKKWEKDNEKKKAEGEKESTEKELEKLLEEVDGLDQELKEEREKKQ
jgi:DNA topoisomerase-1